MSGVYYQLGGSNSNIHWNSSSDVNRWESEKKLAEALVYPSSPLAKNGVVELILGIKRNGTSHLLLTDADVRHFQRQLTPRGYGISSSSFESLSPIEFGDSTALAAKLSRLKPKAKGGKGRAFDRSGFEDTSQANRGFSERDELTRGMYEHGRVIYRILNNTLPNPKYSLLPPTWTSSLRVCSLVFNVQSAFLDNQNSTLRILDPMILDMGFCEAELPGFRPRYSSAKHVVRKLNQFLGKAGKRAFSYGTSEILDEDALSQWLCSLFADRQSPTNSSPMILLVSHKDATFSFLRKMGVDTSSWRHILTEFNIKNGTTRQLPVLRDLLHPGDSLPPGEEAPRGGGGSYSPGSSSRHGDRRYDSRRSSRSRSPPPRSGGRGGYDRDRDRYDSGGHHPTRPSYGHDRRPSASDSASTTPAPSSPRTAYPPVYVVDIHALFQRISHSNAADAIPDIAVQLGVSEEAGWWCAGDEAATAIDIYRHIISSESIDERKEMLQAALLTGRPPPASSSASSTPAPGLSNPNGNGGGGEGGGDDDDEEEEEDEFADPNDMLIRQARRAESQRGLAAAGTGGWGQQQQQTIVDDIYNMDESDVDSDSD